MPIIKVIQEQTPIETIQLAAGAVSIGRAPDNDVHVDDITLSAHHARIYTYFDTSYIEDVGSTNGVYLNGKRVQKHLLHPGDVVQLGKTQLRVEDERRAS